MPVDINILVTVCLLIALFYVVKITTPWCNFLFTKEAAQEVSSPTSS